MDDSPNNLPQYRPVEDFYGYLSDVVYKGGWRAENTAQLKRRIQWAIRRVDLEVVRKMMERVPQRPRKFGREGA